MKKSLLFFLSFGFSLSVCAQEGFTFLVEALSAPQTPLQVRSPKSIYEELILDEVDMHPNQLQHNGIQFPFGIVAMSNNPDSLVNFRYNSFFQGMYHAYADHRPFVLSPDVIWLLISQGFSQHVYANAEQMRSLFVAHEGRKKLEIRDDRIRLTDPDSPWEDVFPRFADTMSCYVKAGLVDLLSADFSTTTPAEKIASQITLMKAMESYFHYVVVASVCGIPQITLLGTPEDWQKILDKTRLLATYDLAWWTGELIPILQQIVKTAQGDVDRDFWRNMFKEHSTGSYGGIYFDGWIVRFFPYDKNGQRNNLQRLEDPSLLPEEIVKVDLLLVEEYPDGSTVSTPLKLWAGFLGLEQNPQTFALKPDIGWMIRKMDSQRQARILAYEQAARHQIEIKTDTFPLELLKLDSIRWLEIEFTDRITIPDELADVTIAYLYLTGKIDSKQKRRLIGLFPHTDLTINGSRHYYRHGKKQLHSLGEPRIPVRNARYRKITDSILRETVAGDFDKVIKYRSAFTRRYKPYGIFDVRRDYADYSDGVRISYEIVLETGQQVYYRYSGADYYVDMDKEGSVLAHPAADYPLDVDFLRRVYALSAQNDFLTLEQAERIASRHIPAKYNKNASRRLIYDNYKKLFYWEIERYYGVRNGEVLKVKMDAVTGEILNIEDSLYEGMRYW